MTRKLKKNYSIPITIGLTGFIGVFLTLFIASILTNTPSYADNEPTASSSLDVDVEVEPVISIKTLDSTGTNEIDSFSLNVTPSSTGTFVKGSFIARIDTNNSSGYSLLLGPYETYLENDTYGDRIPGINTNVSEADFSAGESVYQNHWGYSKAWSETINGISYSGGDLATYLPVMEWDNADIEDFMLRDDVDTPVSNSRTSVGVGANFNVEVAPGTYSNTLQLTAIAKMPLLHFNVVFDKNTDDPVSNMPSNISVSERTSWIGFSIPDTSNVVRDRYVLAGWSLSPTEAIGDGGSGPGGIYVRGDYIYPEGQESQDAEPLTLYAVWARPGLIHYDANGSDVDGTMDDQTTVYINTDVHSSERVDDTALSDASTEITLYAPNFARPGYGFAGWNTRADGTGATFGPNQTLISAESSESVARGGNSPITLTSEMQAALVSDNGLVLYAKWVPSAGDMQNWSGCSNLNIGDVTALTDTRVDNINTGKTYAVAKLADNRCWMIENLRYTGAGISSNEWCDGYTDDECAVTKQYNYTNISSADSTKFPVNIPVQDETTWTYSTDSETVGRWYGYGNYYSWAAAIDDTTPYTSALITAPGVCPAGWRMPGGDWRGELTVLHDALYSGYTGYVSDFRFIGSNAFRIYPNNFVFSGYWQGNRSISRGLVAKYWSAYSSTEYIVYEFALENTLAHAGSGGSAGKQRGYTVRCILDE